MGPSCGFAEKVTPLPPGTHAIVGSGKSAITYSSNMRGFNDQPINYKRFETD